MKKILFVAKFLESGGTEVSLLNFLNELSKNKNVNVDLLLLQKKGIYLDNIPNNVNVISLFPNKYNFFENFNKKTIFKNFNTFIYKILKKINTNLGFKYVTIFTNKINFEKYDIIVDFHGYGYYGTYYVDKHLKANKKIIFIHDEKIDWIKLYKKNFLNFDKYLCVSNSCKKILGLKYPEISDKIEVCHNIVPAEKILLKGNEIKEKLLSDKFNILTIGRFEWQKGYDILVDIALELKNKDIDYIWYIIGTGSQYDEIKMLIEEKGLVNNIKLLGMKKNPYPYLKQCDLYVQPSRHEGYGLAIAEARIFNKPIISTNLDCVAEQIVNNETGILCDLDKSIFTENIIRLINDEKLRNKLATNLSKEKFVVYKELEKIIGD